MQNQINLTPITQFVQQLRSAELSQSKEIKMSIQQARLLNLALTEVLDSLRQDYEALLDTLKDRTSSEVISVTMDGGEFGVEK